MFTGELVTQQSNYEEKKYAEDNGITVYDGEDEQGLGRNGVLFFNSNSGAQAIQLAVFRGAKHIILLGYDMQNTGDKSHWFGDHPDTLTNCNYSAYIHNYNKLASDLERAGIEVVNCSRVTALTQFKRAELWAELLTLTK